MDIKHNAVVEFIARTGYVTKGILYFMVGIFAVRMTFGLGSDKVNSKQVLELFSEQKFGFILLSLVMAGLVAHAIWRIIQGLIDPEERDSGIGSFFFRSVDFVTGLLYLGLSYAAFQILMGQGTTSSNENADIWIAKILHLPFGKWLVLSLALICVIGGLYQFYSAYSASFDYSFDTDNMEDQQKTFLRILGRVGIAAWGIVYCMIGFLLYQAAVTFDPEQAGGMEQALIALSKQPYGMWVLGITAIGLLTYGVYLLVLARFHKIYGE